MEQQRYPETKQLNLQIKKGKLTLELTNIFFFPSKI